MNISQLNATEGKTLTPTAIVLYVSVSTVSLGLNLLALVILIKSKETRKQKFKCLTLCLSISNIITSISVIVAVVYTVLNSLNRYTQCICFVFVLIISIAHTFSLVQVFFICIERFLALRSTQDTRNWRKRLTLSYICSFVLVAAYNGIIFGLYGKTETTSCIVESIFTDNYWIYKLSITICRLITYVIIVVVYGIVILILRKQLTKVHYQDAAAELQRVSNHTKQYKRSIITLGILISILTLLVLPHGVTNIILTSNGNINLP